MLATPAARGRAAWVSLKASGTGKHDRAGMCIHSQKLRHADRCRRTPAGGRGSDGLLAQLATSARLRRIHSHPDARPHRLEMTSSASGRWPRTTAEIHAEDQRAGDRSVAMRASAYECRSLRRCPCSAPATGLPRPGGPGCGTRSTRKSRGRVTCGEHRAGNAGGGGTADGVAQDRVFKGSVHRVPMSPTTRVGHPRTEYDTSAAEASMIRPRSCSRGAVGATTGERDLALAYRATNLLVAPQEALRITSA